MQVKSSANIRRDKRASNDANNRLIVPLVSVIVLAIIIAGYFTVKMIGGIAAENRAINGGPSQTLLDRYNANLPKQYTPYGKPPRPGENRPPVGTYPIPGVPPGQFDPYK